MGSKSTILKDLVHVEEINGRIVRFNKGRSSLMRVDKTELDGFGKRLCGVNIIGDYHAAYAHNCELADSSGLQVWSKTQGDRDFE